MKDWEYHRAADDDLDFKDRFASERRETGLIGLTGHAICRAIVRCYLRLAHRPTVEGLENLPNSTPVVIVANHTSHLDALLLISMLPRRFTGRIFALAAGDTFFTSPAKSLFAGQVVNALPVWRKKATSHAIGHLRDRLLEGDCGFVLFPEGTRSRNGEMVKFKPGVGMLVAETEVAVIPAYLQGAHNAWPPDRKLPKPGKLTVKLGNPLRFDSAENQKQGWKAIAAELEQAVKGLQN